MPPWMSLARSAAVAGGEVLALDGRELL